MSGGHIDDSDYANVMRRGGGSKKIIYILIACSIILIAVVGYLLIQPGKNKQTFREISPTLIETEPAVDTTQTYYVEPETNVTPITTLDPALREKIVRSYRGINTVTDILNTIPSEINFTMIQYSDGKFLLEFLANNDADINSTNNQLQQNLYSADLKLLSKDNRNIQRRQFRQALVNGSVDVYQGGTDATNLQEPSYLNSAELRNQLSAICQQTNLTIKQFDAGLERTDGEFMISPIKFKAVGQKRSILSFLQQLLNENINIGFSKISLIANGVDLTDPNITLVLNITLYRLI
jgi:hypothetical protein